MVIQRQVATGAEIGCRFVVIQVHPCHARLDFFLVIAPDSSPVRIELCALSRKIDVVQALLSLFLAFFLQPSRFVTWQNIKCIIS
jgi:hypothetical protein